VDSWVLEADKRWSEENLGCSAFVCLANVYLRSIWKDVVICIILSSSVILAIRTKSTHPFVGAIVVVSFASLDELVSCKRRYIVVHSGFTSSNLSVTVHLLNPTNNLELGSRAERIA